jgi:hypothetical protein
MNVTLADLWLGIVDYNPEQLHELCSTNEEWRDFLTEANTVEFLCVRFGVKQITHDLSTFFDHIKDTNHDSAIIEACLDSKIYIDEFLADNELCVDSWSLIQILKKNNPMLVRKLESVEDNIEMSDYVLNLVLFTIGRFCNVDTVNEFLELEICTDITYEEGWGPLALGMVTANNVQLFNHIFYDLLLAVCSEDSEYYAEWLHICIMTASYLDNVMLDLRQEI